MKKTFENKNYIKIINYSSIKKIFIIIFLVFLYTNSSVIRLSGQEKYISNQSKAEELLQESWDNLYSNPESAYRTAEKGLEYALLKRDSSVIASYYRFFGSYFLNSALYIKAIDNFTKSLKLVYILKNDLELAHLYNDLGLCYLELFKYEEAKKYFLKSLGIFKNLKKDKYITSVFINISLCYQNTYDYKNSIKYLLQAIRISEKLQDSQSLALEFNNLALIYDYLKNYDIAFKYYNIALKLNKKLNNHLEIANILNNIGNIYNHSNNYDKALEYHNKSLNIKKQLKDRNGEAVILNNIGEVYLQKKEYEEAIKYFNNSLNLKKEINYLSGIVHTTNNLGRVYYKTEDYNKAEYYFLKAVELAKQYDVTNKDAHYYLSEIYNKNQDFHKALEHLQLYTDLQDSVYGTKNVQEINDLLAGYLTEKKDVKISELEAENKFKEKQIKERTIFILILLLLFITIVVIAVFLRKSQKKTLAVSKDLEEALDELRKVIEIKNRTEQELRDAKEKLAETLKKEKELNELKTRFISMVSHEYRHPLTTILTNTELIKVYYERNDKEKLNKTLKTIRTQIDSMVDLLSDVLTVSRQETKTYKMNIKEFQLSELCKDVIAHLKEIHKTEHNIILNFDCENDIIRTEASYLKHILLNLIDNAIKYSPDEPKINFDVNCYKNKIVIEISDNGIGIPEEDQKYLFDPFFRSNNVGSISGTGLGLTIVRMYVDMLYGEIELESNEKTGTKFRITLPKNIDKIVKNKD
jgi:signal transduction histidine kinase